MMSYETNVSENQNSKKFLRSGVVALLLVIILAGGAYLRFTGLDWGEFQHQHPDELFLTGVTSSITLPGTAAEGSGAFPTAANQPWREQYPEVYHDCADWGGYFDTACSPLNPHNRGYTFYVYGTLPLFIVRSLAEWGEQLDNLKLFGRQLSAVADLLTVLLVFLIALRLYGRRVALLAAAFSTLTVMQIQQSHFYATDNFAVTFMTLAVYFAVEIVVGREKKKAPPEPREESENGPNFENHTPGSSSRALYSLGQYLWQRELILSILFGMAYGMALASKLTAAPLAVLLPLAFFIRYWKRGETILKEKWQLIVISLFLGGFFAVLTFRVFQPYAFDGLGLNPAWIASIREQRAQATPDSDIPWNLQWARRTHLYSFENLTLWGLGLPLGILAWIGFLWMGWRVFRGEWRQHLLVWSWTAFYFIWQSLQYNPTMRYQLPIYPFLAIMAAWFIFTLAEVRRQTADQRPRSGIYRRLSALCLAVIVLVSTAAWAFAFSRIYTRDEPRIAASKWIYQNVPGPVNLQIQTADGSIYQQPLSFPAGMPIPLDRFQIPFTAQQDGLLTSVLLGHVADSSESGVQTLTLYLTPGTDLSSEQILASASAIQDFSPLDDPRGGPVTLTLSQPMELTKGQMYYLGLAASGGEPILSGSAVVNETDYDWSLPFRLDGYDGFGGLYQGDLNLQVYWNDDAAKLERFLQILDQGDYIFIPTSHQYAQITRLPERYPLTTAYYQALLGCPAEISVIDCYRVAEPGMFEEQLGFELVATFDNFPSIGSLEINDQLAEEAFTFYDHPKSFIFQKTANYDPARVRAILGAVDLSKVVQLTPRQANGFSGNLTLPPERLAEQRSGGTWSALFDYESFQNKYPLITVVLWYLVVSLLGWLTYPFVRYAMPGLADRGYPLVRSAGLMLLAYLAWLAGSVRLPFSRGTIFIALILVALLGGVLAYHQRAELRVEWREKRKYFLTVELLTLAFFLFGLLVRFGNPDLWHPWKGGEKPMDFSYFNAVLKSTSFPPYDPWFAGGYINYYYYGFVIVGVLVKLLGIVPSIAYNLILPSLLAMIAMGAFSVGWNLIAGRKSQIAVRKPPAGEPAAQLASASANGPIGENTDVPERQPLPPDSQTFVSPPSKAPFFTGLSAAFFMAISGNLGTLRMILDGFKVLAAPQGNLEGIGFLSRIWLAIKGFFLALTGSPLPYRMDEWYWNPSRAIAGEHGNPITEFPYFTFLYGDLHAHLIALPAALLAIAWALSVVLSRAWLPEERDADLQTGRRSIWQIAAGLFLGGLVIGALYPINLSDIYTYLPLGIAALAYAIWFYGDSQEEKPQITRRLIFLVVSVAALVVLSLFLYQPYSRWYAQGYSEIQLWRGTHTPMADYLTHWGAFLFIFVSWLIYESIDWMAATPVSALRKLKPYRGLIWGLLIVLAGVILILGINLYPEGIPFDEKLPIGLGLHVIWLVLPLIAWTGVLLLRPDISDAKRFAFFLMGTGLVLTLMVEIVVVSGDIGRMNTIFKFYLHVWTLFAVSAAAALTWMWQSLSKWNRAWRFGWQVGLMIFLGTMLLYPLTATPNKIRDRMAEAAPHTLDGMTYMQYATYFDLDTEMDLSQDYAAIRWLQDHIEGSPVIVEGHLTEYRWGTRNTIYTGLPGVVGWNWHQRQQRTLLPDTWVWDRVNAIDEFYRTTDLEIAARFLDQFDVSFIILGQLERANYQGDGLIKFAEQNGRLWNEIYRDRDTVIYEVIRE